MGAGHRGRAALPGDARRRRSRDGCDAVAPDRKPTLRSNAELLDALDLCLRLHGITRQAQVDGTLPVAGVDTGVVQERHVARNWLLRVQDVGWDDVDTPT